MEVSCPTDNSGAKEASSTTSIFRTSKVDFMFLKSMRNTWRGNTAFRLAVLIVEVDRIAQKLQLAVRRSHFYPQPMFFSVTDPGEFSFGIILLKLQRR